MKRIILSVFFVLIFLLVLPGPVSASRYAFGEKETFLLYHSGDKVVGHEVSIQILPDTINLNESGMIVVLVTIPDEYAGVGAEDLAGSRFRTILSLTDIDIDFIGPLVFRAEKTVQFAFNLTDGKTEVQFYGIDTVTFLNPVPVID